MDKVPLQEITRRMEAFQSRLEKKGLDGALILQNVDLYYFAGTIQSSMLFMPARGRPVLMVQKNWTRARAESPLETVVPLPGGKASLESTLAAQGLALKGNVGLEMDVLPTSVYLWLTRQFTRCSWKDVSPLIRRQRMLKSAYEVEQIRQAARILDRGFRALQQVIRPGMTELEVDGHMALIARREGHMGILRMRGWNQEMTYAHVLAGESGSMSSFLNSAHGGSGTTPAVAQGAGFRRIVENVPIGIDYGVGVGGYLGDQFRTFVIGDLPPKLQKAHDCSLRIHQRFTGEVKPGASCSTLYEMALEEAVASGLAEFFMGHGEGQVHFIGHGLGLEIDEYPIIGKGSPVELEPGMVFALEPKFVFPGEGVIGLEDDYLVTEKGLERITLTEQAVMHVEAAPPLQGPGI